MRGLLHDVTVAARRLRGAPGFTVFSILTLALGIGVTSAIHSLIRGTLLRPPQIRDIDRVVNIYHAYPFSRPGSSIALSFPDFIDLSWSQRSFQQLTAWTRIRAAVSSGGMSTVILGEVVSASYFPLVGAQARIGRTLLPPDDGAGASPVVVISESLWRRRFASDPGVVGRPMTVNGRAAEIVGVIALPFQGVDMPNVLPTAMWMPVALGVGASQETVLSRAGDRETRGWLVKGRLRDGVSLAQAAAEVSAIARRLDEVYPIGGESDRLRRERYAIERQWQVMPAADVRVHESMHLLVAPVAVTVAVMVVVVLLVVSTNLANLLLARGGARRHEFAVRAALGASRARIVRELLIESLIVAVAGGTTGLWVAHAAIRALVSSTVRFGPGVWLELTPTVDASVVIAAFVLSALAFVVFGVLPAMRLARAELQRALQASELTGAVQRWRGRATLIGAQVAVSAALVVIAIMSGQHVLRSLRHDAGVDIDRVAAAQIDFGLARYDEQRARETSRRLLAAANRDGHFQRAALSSGLPIGLSAPTVAVGASGELRKVYSTLLAVSPSFWDVTGIAISRGRALSELDTETQNRAGVISESLARTLFATADVVGRAIVVFERVEREAKPLLETYTIVGVAEDTDVGGAGRRDRGVLYVPFAQHYESRMAIVVRSTDPDEAAALLTELVRRVDAAVAVSDVGSWISLSGIANVPLQVAATLTGSLGGVALILAMSGLYAVLSYVVAGRRREIGVRRALGATPSSVMRLIVFDGLRPVAIGIAIGVATGAVIQFGASRFLSKVPPFDALVLLLVPLLFVGAGLLASYLPARRASRIEPGVALRDL